MERSLFGRVTWSILRFPLSRGIGSAGGRGGQGVKVLLLLLLAAAAPAGADDRTDLEYQVKAAFLFNFAKFVEWPADAFEGPQDPVAICVLGRTRSATASTAWCGARR